MVLQGFVSELINSKISLFVVIEPNRKLPMHDVQFLCNLKRLNILIPVFQKHKIQIGVTGDFKYFASLFGN
jgi:hypothetical protein